MPRKSSSSSDIVALPVRRDPPKPPPDLTQAQAEQWQAICSVLPADYFRGEALATLAELCRAITDSREFARWLDAHPLDSLKTPADLRQHATISRLRLTASNLVARLSSKLRLLPSNRYQPINAASKAGLTGHRQPAGPRPWDRRNVNDQGDDGAA